MSAEPRPRSTRLSVTGGLATWTPTPWAPGAFTLSVNGEEQSTTDPSRPEKLFYEYLQRMAAAIDAFRPAPAPLAVLHLGGGALSLPRRLAAQRPGSRAVVVDRDPELLPFVLSSMPLPAGTDLTPLVGDVRDALPAAVKSLGPEGAGVVVLDIALGPESPERLLQETFMAELLDAAAPSGLVLINVGDEAGLPATRLLVSGLRRQGAAVFAAAPSPMFDGEEAGNVILGASRGRWPRGFLRALQDAGPHPGRVLAGSDLP